MHHCFCRIRWIRRVHWQCQLKWKNSIASLKKVTMDTLGLLTTTTIVYGSTWPIRWLQRSISIALQIPSPNQCKFTVTSTGAGQTARAFVPVHVKMGQGNDGCQKRPYTFHVSLAPPFKFLDPLLERFEPCRGDLFLDLVLNRKQLLMKVHYDFLLIVMNILMTAGNIWWFIWWLLNTEIPERVTKVKFFNPWYFNLLILLRLRL